jgi:hypothetical protein
LYFGRLIYGQEDVVIEHNTTYYLNQSGTDQGGGIQLEGSIPIQNLTFRDNLTPLGQYGFKMSGQGSNGPSLTAGVTGTRIVTNNTFPGRTSGSFNCGGCSDNFFPTTAQWDANVVGWSDPTLQDFTLRPSSTYLKSASDGLAVGVDPTQLPTIRNLQVQPSSQAAAVIWDLTAPIADRECTLEVSKDRNLQSKLGEWTTVADVDPALYQGSDLASRPGNIQDGLRRVFVLGTDAEENGVSRRLEPGTTYYYRLACPGDTLLGQFDTQPAPAESTRNVTVSAQPLSGKGVTAVVVQYGEKESGAPATMAHSKRQDCTDGCSIELQGVSLRPLYYTIEYRDSSDEVVWRSAPAVTP